MFGHAGNSRGMLLPGAEMKLDSMRRPPTCSPIREKMLQGAARARDSEDKKRNRKGALEISVENNQAANRSEPRETVMTKMQ